jgi:hypothetical protein
MSPKTSHDPRTTRQRSRDWQTHRRSLRSKSPMSLSRDPRTTRQRSRDWQTRQRSLRSKSPMSLSHDPRTTRRRSRDWQMHRRSLTSKSPMSPKTSHDPRTTRRKSHRSFHRRSHRQSRRSFHRLSHRESHRWSHWTRPRTRASPGHRPRVHVLARTLVGPHRPASVQGGMLPDSHNDPASRVSCTRLQPGTCTLERPCD